MDVISIGQLNIVDGLNILLGGHRPGDEVLHVAVLLERIVLLGVDF